MWSKAWEYLVQLPKPVLILLLLGAIGLSWLRYEALAEDVQDLKVLQAQQRAINGSLTKIVDELDRRVWDLRGAHTSSERAPVVPPVPSIPPQPLQPESPHGP